MIACAPKARAAGASGPRPSQPELVTRSGAGARVKRSGLHGEECDYSEQFAVHDARGSLQGDQPAHFSS